jgi:catechol 2,3-dioxygenase-like lactoylglutathione lyase family enzyme
MTDRAQPGTPDGGFHEAVLVVGDAARVAASYGRAFGYRSLNQGRVSAETAAFYGLDGLAGAPELLIGEPGQGRGYVRLLQAPAGLPIGRFGGQAWDTGGIFDLDIRALGDIEAMTARAADEGFVPLAPITDYDFAGLKVREVVMVGHDGVGMAIISQEDPPLGGYEAAEGPASYAFNSTQVVRSLDEARAFFIDALGWKPVYETRWAHPGSGLNCLGMPLNLARTHDFKVGIYHPQGVNFGSVEMLEIEGLEGFDFRAPPGVVRRGIAALRFPVSDLDSTLAAVRRGGGSVVAEPREIEIAPYGAAALAAVETPWGARLEFYRSIEGSR